MKSYLGKKTTNFVGINRAKHKNLAKNPSRKVLSLYYAMENLGIEYEREKEFDAGDYPLWFNVTIQIGGQDAVVFLFDESAIKPEKYYNARTRKRKLAFLRENNIPFCEVRRGTSSQIQAEISLWLATIKTRPQRPVVGHKPKVKKIMRGVRYGNF